MGCWAFLPIIYLKPIKIEFKPFTYKVTSESNHIFTVVSTHTPASILVSSESKCNWWPWLLCSDIDNDYDGDDYNDDDDDDSGHDVYLCGLECTHHSAIYSTVHIRKIMRII